MASSLQVVVNCADPDRLATFWAAALGYKKQDPPEGHATWPEFLASMGVPESEWSSASAVVDPAGGGPRLFFQRVPEPKAGKNRLHLDLNVGGGHATPLDERGRRIEAEAERLVGLGATIQDRKAREQWGERWIVMLDPEGNELCLQ